MQSVVENANIPAFVGKLWRMVDDPATDHLICWSPTGNSFIIQNQAQFWYELLPLYYKHNNMSSFVRQLNMYGFHKISSVENGTMDADKDEIQFYHAHFQKDHPEKLVHVKRKVTPSRVSNSKAHDNQSSVKHDELTKVLNDIIQLRGRQSTVDAQVSAMRQENAVLWRELALLRQKHMKQQQIVNKLIQFLVTLVQPATTSNRMGVGVKRKLPLMLHENKRGKPKKSARSPQDTGPTIFELDNEIAISPNELLGESLEEDVPLINSPATGTSTSSNSSPKFINSPLIDPPVQSDVECQESSNKNFHWDKPEFVNIDASNDPMPDPKENLINKLSTNTEQSSGKIFINPNNRNTLISSSIKTGSYNPNVNGVKNASTGKKQYSTNTKQQAINTVPDTNMQVATKNNQVKIGSGNFRNVESIRAEDLDQHVDHAQHELEQLKDILNGCSTFDANALLGLLTENDPDYGIRGTLQNKEIPVAEASDPLVAGSELTPAGNLIDFNELFSLHNEDNNLTSDTDMLNSAVSIPNSPLSTPLMVKNEPVFPKRT